MRAVSKRRGVRVGRGKEPRKPGGFVVALTIFVAATMDGYATDQTLGAPATSMNAGSPARLSNGTNSSPPAGESSHNDSKNLVPPATPAITDVQWTGNKSLVFKTEPEEPVVLLPEFNVKAQGYSGLEQRLDQIDRGIDREQTLSVPDKLDLLLNSGKILPRLISLGEETAEKRARDAYNRMQILEMQRSIGLGLLYATPAVRKQLKADQELLKELSAPRFDEEFTGHPWTRQ
jgi:hypothetical protein